MNNNNREYYIELFETYGKLFTNKQIEVFQNYFFEDLTIDEIASELNISKAAISDSLKKTKNQLAKFEQAVGALEMKKQLEKK